MSSESSISDLSSDWDVVASYTSSNENKESDSPEMLDSTIEIENSTIDILDSTTETQDITTEIQNTTTGIEDATTVIEDTTTGIEDTTTGTEDTTTGIEDNTTEIQNNKSEVEDNRAEAQDNTTDVCENTIKIEDMEVESNNIKLEVISNREEELEVASQQSDISSCSDIEVIDEITDLNINEPILDMSVPQAQAMFTSKEYIREQILELPQEEITELPQEKITDLPQETSKLPQETSKLPQETSKLPQVISELSQDKPVLPQKILDLPTTPNLSANPEVTHYQRATEVKSTRTAAADSGFLSMTEENYSHSMIKNILKVFFVVITSIYLWNHFHQSTVGKDDLKEMLEHMKHLTDTFREENAELREQLLSEMQNKNLYSSLETQITQLKDENLKLNHMLQNMILDLQKPSRFAESDSLGKEMNKLKDQINVLKFENEELQKQVGKFRYSDRAPKDHRKDVPRDLRKDVPEDHKKDVPEADLGKQNDGKVETDENTTSTSEMDKLHQELVIEIEKIKQWNIIIETITRELHKTTPKEKKKWSFKEVKQSLNNIVEEAQRNIMDTVGNFQRINISDIFTKYVQYDDAGTKNVLNSIKQFYETTKEKTIKIFKEDIHKDAIVNNAWSTVDKVAKKWNRMKQYFGMTEEDVNDQGLKHDARDPSQDKTKTFNKKDDINKRSFTDPQGKIVIEDAQNVHDKHSSEENWYFKKKQDAEKEHQPDSWLFGRAAYREKERKNDDTINWYLKRKKYQKRNTYGEDFMDDDKYPTYD